MIALSLFYGDTWVTLDAPKPCGVVVIRWPVPKFNCIYLGQKYGPSMDIGPKGQIKAVSKPAPYGCVVDMGYVPRGAYSIYINGFIHRYCFSRSGIVEIRIVKKRRSTSRLYDCSPDPF